MGSYDVLGEAEKIEEPCLLLQGEEDYQVTMEDFGIWKDALGEKENWRMISYPGLTHLFMPGLKNEGSTAYAREAKVDEQVIQDISGFILAE
jgi:fermentation-respiration switch protein FrsA (DUF1100 family)